MNRLTFSALGGALLLALTVVSPGSVTAAERPEITEPAEIQEYRGVDSVEVHWQHEYDAKFTHIILARDRAFQKIVYENMKVPGTFYLLENLDYGTYFLKIRFMNDRGRGGSFSEMRTFVVAPPPPSTTVGHMP